MRLSDIDVFEKLIKYKSTLSVSIEELRKDSIVIASSFLSTDKLSIALNKYKPVEILPIMGNFHKMLNVIPEEILCKLNIFASYQEYEEYIFSRYYFNNKLSRRLLPSIDILIFNMLQYFGDQFDKLNADINLNSSFIFNEIPYSHHKTITYIKKVFENAYKKYIMVTDFTTTDPLLLAIFTRVNHLILNDFYSIRICDWEIIQLFDIRNPDIKIDHSILKRKKNDFINLFFGN